MCWLTTRKDSVQIPAQTSPTERNMKKYFFDYMPSARFWQNPAKTSYYSLLLLPSLLLYTNYESPRVWHFQQKRNIIKIYLRLLPPIRFLEKTLREDLPIKIMDNDPKAYEKLYKDVVPGQKINYLEWPAQTPDLKII